ncbi:MAG: histidine kinase, partial [Acidobacteria bacterium]|nr:histidine kinase [Acidobacteriota bacterium]
MAVLFTCYRYLDFPATNRIAIPFLRILLEQLFGSYGLFVLLPLVFWSASKHKLHIYIPAFIAYTLLHTTWNWGTRILVFPIFGLGEYNYGNMPIRYLMEAPSDLIAFCLTSFLRRSYLNWQRLQAIEQSYAQARMQLLTRQLQPHFLFNSLNTISALMHEDIPKADLVLTRLSEFLRATIDLQSETTIPLKQELDLLNNYVSVMQARLEDKLSFNIDCQQSLFSIPVPPLLLQPLIENVIEHGRDPLTGKATIQLSILRQNDNLVCKIKDQGPGLKPSKSGFGLDAVRQRLHATYGDQATLTLEQSDGVLVTVEFPAC